MRDAREARLPKWAQSELANLRRELATAERQANEMRAQVGDTNVHVRNYSEADQPLPMGSTVRFRLGDERWDQYLDARIEGNTLFVHGGRSLVIHPYVANAVRISVTD